MDTKNLEVTAEIIKLRIEVPSLAEEEILIEARSNLVAEAISKKHEERDSKPRAIESNIKNLHAIDTPNNAERKLKIKPIVSMVKRVDYFQSVCSYTGIVMEVAIPAIDGLVLEYTNPLSYWSNVKGIIEQGESYLERLELQVLAGLWITAYRNFELIDLTSSKTNSSLLNAMIRTAGKQVLIDSLLMAGHLTTRTAKRCARYDTSYDAHKEAPNMMASIQEFTRSVRDSVYPPEELKISAEEKAIDDKYEEKSYSVRLPARKANHKITTAQEIAEDNFKTARKEGKILLKAMEEEMIVPIPFLSLLKTVFTDKNLSSMAPSIRTKMIAKLLTYQNKNCERMAKLLEVGADPYDIFADAASDLVDDKVVDSIPTVTNRNLTLAEKLAFKKAARLAKEQAESRKQKADREASSEEQKDEGSDF